MPISELCITLAQSDAGSQVPPPVILALLFLVWRVLLALLAATIAERRGHPRGWFWGGLFFGLVGVIFPLALPDQREKSRRQEQLRALARYASHLERKLDALRDYCRSRFDAVDEATGTRTAGAADFDLPSRPEGLDDLVEELLAEGQRTRETEELPESAKLPPPTKRDREVEWYYREEGEKMGPIKQYELKRRLIEGEMACSTLVWAEGMDTYRRALDVPDLLDALPEE